jgi:hypothetical protein
MISYMRQSMTGPAGHGALERAGRFGAGHQRGGHEAAVAPAEHAQARCRRKTGFSNTARRPVGLHFGVAQTAVDGVFKRIAAVGRPAPVERKHDAALLGHAVHPEFGGRARRWRPVARAGRCTGTPARGICGQRQNWCGRIRRALSAGPPGEGMASSFVWPRAYSATGFLEMKTILRSAGLRAG